MVTKKRPGNTANKNHSNSKKQSVPIKKSTEKTNTSNNIHNIKNEAEQLLPAQDINHKLTNIEDTLTSLETRFYLSHQEFEQLLSGVNERSDLSKQDIKELQSQLAKLNSSYQVLDTQSSRLAKESGRLALLIDKLNVDTLEGVDEFEQQATKRLESLEKEHKELAETLKTGNQQQLKVIDALDSKTTQQLELQTDSLRKQAIEWKQQSTDLTQQYQQALQELEKQLGTQQQEYQLSSQQQLEQQHQQWSAQYTILDDKLNVQQQAAKNFSLKVQQQFEESERKIGSAQQFLDQKQQAIIQQSENLAAESQAHKQSIHQLDQQMLYTEQRSKQFEQDLGAQRTHLENDSELLKGKLSQLAEKSQYEYEDLLQLNKHNRQQTEQLNERQEQLSEVLGKLDDDNQIAQESMRQQLAKQDSELESTEKELQKFQADQKTQTEELIQFDQKLALGAHHLEQRTEILEREESLHQQKIAQLAQQASANTDLSKKNQRQVNFIIHREGEHFKLLGGSLLLLIILLLVGGLFSYGHFEKMQQADYTAAEQNALQKNAIQRNLDNGKQLQQTISQQQQAISMQQQRLVQQQSHLTEEQQGQYQQLQQQITQMQEQLTQQQQLIYDKDKTIAQLNREVQEVDDNLQYLNNSIGPYKAYNRHAYQGKLNSIVWLQQQPVDNYIVQLLQVPNKQYLFQFIQRYGYYLTHKLAYYPRTDGESTQYILSYGSFKDKKVAQQALDVLPATISRYNQGILQIKKLPLK